MKEKQSFAKGKKQPFQLLRYFSTASLIAFLLVGVFLITLYRQIAISELIEVGESKNVAITQSFSNVIWPQFSDFLNESANLTTEEIKAHPETAHLHQAVLEQMQGLTVIKVKIYTLNGKTVFSTEESQIGEDKSENAGFVTALEGKPANELTHSDTFSAFEGDLENRDVISSYVPIRRGSSAEVEGVFEVYDDVTPLFKKISTNQRNIGISVTLILTLLYGVLFLLVKRSDALIRKQFYEQEHAEELIKEQFYEQKRAEEQIKESHAREEKINDFFHFTLLNIIGYVERGIGKTELLSYLEQIKGQFDELKYWVSDDTEK